MLEFNHLFSISEKEQLKKGPVPLSTRNQSTKSTNTLSIRTVERPFGPVNHSDVKDSTDTTESDM